MACMATPDIDVTLRMTRLAQEDLGRLKRQGDDQGIHTWVGMYNFKLKSHITHFTASSLDNYVITLAWKISL